MFSATNVAGIAATVALIGAVTLALPTDPQPAEPPLMAPTSEAGGVTTFTSEMTVLGQDQAGDAEYLDWGVDKPGEQYTTRITSSDPRMSGMSTGFQNVYEVGPMKTRLQAWNGRLFTDEGSWLESGRAYQDPEFTLHTTWYSIGEGAYEGLAAITLCEQAHVNADWTCHGVISEVGWPEFPPEAPTEIPSVHLGQ